MQKVEQLNITAFYEGVRISSKEGDRMQKLATRDNVVDDKKGAATEPLEPVEDVLTIQQMAQITGLSAHTLRYYERAGLMQQHVGRNDTNGYRTYTRQHIAWIEFIKCLRATGMPIRYIQRYTELLQEGEQTAPDRMRLLKEHRSQVEAHLRETEQYLAAINKKIAFYERSQALQQPVCGENLVPGKNE